MHQLDLSEPKPDHMELLRLILARGANLDARDAEHGTPLDVARRYDCEPIVRLLEKHRGNPRPHTV
jgi:ankyrin repeat protein